MAKRNAPFVAVDDLPFDAPAGHAIYVRRDGKIVGIQFGCPCGCGAHYGATFLPPNNWTFDGNEAKPTVNPSLGCYPAGQKVSAVGPDGTYHWHGYLKAGVFEEC